MMEIYELAEGGRGHQWAGESDSWYAPTKVTIAKG